MHVLHHLLPMLAQLRSFLVVIEESSLRRAAMRLHISQPALSRQMQALEDEVGGRLLERTSSGVFPTAAGHALAAKIQPILESYDAVMAGARRLARGEREELRIGYIASAAQKYLTPALAALRKVHPKVKVKLLDLSPGEQIAALRAGEIDLAVTGRAGGLLASDFYVRKLATLSLLAVVSADHPLASRKSVRLVELKKERFFSTPESEMPGRDRWLTQLCRKRGGFRPKFGGSANSVAHAFTLVVNEGLIGLMPDYFREHPAPGVAMVPVDDAQATWDFFIVWQRGLTAGPLRVLLDSLSAAANAVCVVSDRQNPAPKS